MKLNMLCVGGKISFNQFKAVFDEAGANSLISLQDAHMMPRRDLLSLISNANNRNLEIMTSATKSSATDLLEFLSSISHQNSSITIEDIDNYPAREIPEIIRAIGTRKFPISINSPGINQNTGPALIKQLLKLQGPLYLSSLTSMTAAAVDAILGAIGSSTFELEVDGKATTPQRTIDTLKKIHPNTNFSIINTEAFSTSLMPSIAEAIGNKNCTLNMSARSFNLQQLRTFLPKLGASVTVSIHSAHLFHPRDIPEIINLLGTRRIRLNFNGSQLAEDPVDGDLLKNVIALSGSNHTITINTAQHPPLKLYPPCNQFNSSYKSFVGI